MFAIALTGFLTMMGALIGFSFGKGKGFNTEVLMIFAGSASFFVMSVILAPYISTIFTCVASVVG